MMAGATEAVSGDSARIRVDRTVTPMGERLETVLADLEPRLMGYLYHACRDRTAAEDLYQEVTLRLHREWRGGGRPDRPDAWAFRVAHNLSVNRFKRRDAERRALRVVGDRPPGTGDAPAEAAGRRELSEGVRRALDGLPEDQRQAVCLKIWGERTWVEIGHLLGTSDDAAARLFARGLRSLAPQLEGFRGNR